MSLDDAIKELQKVIDLLKSYKEIWENEKD